MSSFFLYRTLHLYTLLNNWLALRHTTSIAENNLGTLFFTSSCQAVVFIFSLWRKNKQLSRYSHILSIRAISPIALCSLKTLSANSLLLEWPNTLQSLTSILRISDPSAVYQSSAPCRIKTWSISGLTRSD